MDGNRVPGVCVAVESESTKQSLAAERAGRSGAAGFTLIELMVVLVIIAMLSCLIVPSVASALRRGGVRSEAVRLSELLNFAYMSAVTRRCAVVFNLDSARGIGWVSSSRPTWPWLTDADEPKTETLATMQVPADVRVTIVRGQGDARRTTARQAWETITFLSDGTAEDCAIELVDADGARAELEVYGVTGEVHIKEPGL